MEETLINKKGFYTIAYWIEEITLKPLLSNLRKKKLCQGYLFQLKVLKTFENELSHIIYFEHFFDLNLRMTNKLLL